MSQFMWMCLAQCLHITHNQLRLVESDSLGEAGMFGEYFRDYKKEDHHVFVIKMIFRDNLLSLAHSLL